MFNSGVDMSKIGSIFIKASDLVDLGTRMGIPWIDIGISLMICLSLGWVGWVLVISILHIASVRWVGIGVAVISNWDEIRVSIVIILEPSIVSPVPTWLHGSISHGSFGWDISSWVSIGALTHLVAWVQAT